MHLSTLMFLFLSIESSEEAQPKCMFKFDLSVCVGGEKTEDKKVCHNQDACGKIFDVAYVRMEPYSSELVTDMLRTCCGSCLKIRTNQTYNYVSQIPTIDNSTSDFYFPVLGQSNALKLYGYHFLPLVETPSIYYITRKIDDVMIQMIVSCFGMWPLLLNCILMMTLSGFIGWLLETWHNEEEFPRHFFTGWFEGVWWSFISMTTVGYGDKTPKTIPARLFSILWIVVGITTFSFITAMLSAELTQANSLPPPTITGAKVGALRNRLYDAIFIAKHGGVLVDANSNDTIVEIGNLIKKLQDKDIDGFILDRYTLLVFYNYMEGLGSSDVVSYLKTKTIQTELHPMGEPLSYGALVKSQKDYDFLSDFVIDNRNVINTCNNLLMNKFSSGDKSEKVENALFSTSGKVFLPTFATLVVIITFIAIIGVIFECHRRRKNPKSHEKVALHDVETS